ncbi:2-dehydropantoate 2-reductase [Pelagicoccus sp. SDUM812002]|uniref:2-dehydropantoate 2-reductase n=1 Tax=Pelagicoccus sp. SDUM812002 TaxID=3041266 RepID=UPI00280C6DBE|nr:2-dehydropantoate 2-reductase [Pelagicoccus sp. SDUM812002]MDQ8185905.1 2-dehydropantoate 2-reductase [Pelagicoccus sp. SDUM812002]
MPKIAVIGPGAIGGTLASFLLENPQNTASICARTPFEKLEITANSQTLTHPVTVHTHSSSTTLVDWIVLATKTYQVPQAANWFERLSGHGTRIAVVQNGVEHLANLTPYFPVERIVPVIIDCPAERKSHGQIIRHGDVRIDVPNTPESADFATLFDDPAVTVNLTDDWSTAAWRKLCINAAGAISALVNQPANIAADPRAADIMKNLIQECIAVGRAEGATLDETIIQTVVSGAAAAPDGSMNSLHADLVAHRPMEWDARNGVIARLGKKHRIPTPYNELTAHLLSLLESKP